MDEDGGGGQGSDGGGEDGRREENLFLQIDVNHRRNPAQQ